jgi:hypothetical protein
MGAEKAAVDQGMLSAGPNVTAVAIKDRLVNANMSKLHLS